MILRHARGHLSLDCCLVMGILNRTPDSFYDGGRMSLEACMRLAAGLEEHGADILDVGAVKAGPGDEVSEQEETARLLPLVEELAARIHIPLSVETGRPRVAARALQAGAAILNDVTGLEDPALAGVAAEEGAALVLMHHGGQLRGRPLNPRYEDVVAAVVEEWGRLAARATSAGVGPESIVADPGIDFGKTTFHSLELVRRLPELVAAGYPLLMAASRKDVVGETLALPPDDRLEGSLALVALAVRDGVRIVRVHDVKETVRVVRIVEAVDGRRRPGAAVRGLWE